MVCSIHYTASMPTTYFQSACLQVIMMLDTETWHLWHKCDANDICPGWHIGSHFIHQTKMVHKFFVSFKYCHICSYIPNTHSGNFGEVYCFSLSDIPNKCHTLMTTANSFTHYPKNGGGNTLPKFLCYSQRYYTSVSIAHHFGFNHKVNLLWI